MADSFTSIYDPEWWAKLPQDLKDDCVLSVEPIEALLAREFDIKPLPRLVCGPLAGVDLRDNACSDTPTQLTAEAVTRAMAKFRGPFDG